MRKVLIKAPATSANVGPGYDIFAVALKEPYDEIELSLNNSGKVTLEVDDNSQGIPTIVKDNVAGLAILEFLKRYPVNEGIHIRIIKHMCSGGGMGTTGASAAASVFGLDHLLGLKLCPNEMIDIARMGEIASGGSPHADNVAAAICGGFIVVKNYNPIDVIKLNIGQIPVVLANITKSQRTTRGFITYEIGEKKLKEQMARVARVIHALHTGNIREFGDAISIDHIHVPVRSAAIPQYEDLRMEVLAAGAYGYTISGGGSSIIAFCPENKQDEIAGIFEKGLANNPNFVKVYKTFTSNQGVQIIKKH